MAETTVDRKTLRRAIASEARMEFFTKYAAKEVLVTGGPDTDATSSSLPDSTAFDCALLTQTDGHWKNGYVYVVSDSASSDSALVGEERPISDFTRKNGRVMVEYPFSAALEVNAVIEIHEIWSPQELHSAIDKSIRLGGRVFSDVVEDDTTFVVLEDQLEYDLSLLTKAPRRMLSVWFEDVSSELTGRADSATSTTVEVNSWAGQLTNADTTWWVSIYNGTGRGQVRRFVSSDNDSGTITVSAWATTPDTSSKLKAWNGDSQVLDWKPLTAGRTDVREYPDYFRFTHLYPAAEGRRIRMLYLATPGALTEDSSTTVVNQDYITHKSLSILHDSLVGDNRFNQNKHANLAEYHDQLASGILRDFMRRLPQRRLMQPTHPGGRLPPWDNPMGWYGG